MALVFQYGSNMSLERINSKERLNGDARLVGIAYTEDDYELVFDIWSETNRCAAADIIQIPSRKIWGVLYDVPDYLINRKTSRDRKSLDAIEGEGTNYDRVPIILKKPDGFRIDQEVITYIGKDRKNDIKTSLEYCGHILVGLRQHKIPDEYVSYVKKQIIINKPSLEDEINEIDNKLCQIIINQKTIIPLFNLTVEQHLKFVIDEQEFAEKLTAHIFPEPIQVSPLSEANTEHEKPVQIHFPIPATTIYILPWLHGEHSLKERYMKYFPTDQLPTDFDSFDDLGCFALRAGSGGGAGFRTTTTFTTKRYATAILLIEFDQTLPKQVRELIGHTNPYELNLTESLLYSLKLYTGQEPHQYKGFHFINDQLIDVVSKWPLMEMQGQPMQLKPEDLDELKHLFMQIWRIRVGSRESIGLRIVNLAIEYYYLSSIMTETRTIFMYLMICFEALFKFPKEKSAGPAGSRMAKLIAESKHDYEEIHKLMWNPQDKDGCSQIRNQIVHGDLTSLSTEVFWKLKALLRKSLLMLISLISTSKINHTNYYASLDSYVNDRDRGLPNI